MKLVVLSYPEPFAGEVAVLTRLFEEGLEYFHLRKYDLGIDELRSFLSVIPGEFHNRITLHHNHELATEFAIGGLHYSSRTPLNGAMEKGVRTSTSCHSVEQIRLAQEGVDYCFLSPIYDSISKMNYKSKFTDKQLLRHELESIVHTEVIALGGVSASHCKELSTLGFDGVAVLGSLWKAAVTTKDHDLMIANFKTLQTECKNVRLQYQ